jgi:hypothetical protein
MSLVAVEIEREIKNACVTRAETWREASMLGTKIEEYKVLLDANLKKIAAIDDRIKRMKTFLEWWHEGKGVL